MDQNGKPLSGGKKVPGRLVAAGTALVLAIYTAGYLRTEGSIQRFDLDRALREMEAFALPPSAFPADELTATPTAVPTVEPTPEPEPAPEAAPTASIVAAPAAAPPRPTPLPPRPTAVPAAPPPPPVAQSGYRDGAYVAAAPAWNHGTLQVTVVISGGRIVSATVTAATIRYPSSDVNPLVQEAVSRQGVPFGQVSGATASADAYKEAVLKALQQARGG